MLCWLTFVHKLCIRNEPGIRLETKKKKRPSKIDRLRCVYRMKSALSSLHCFKLWCQEWLSHLPTITWWMDLGVFVFSRVGRVEVVVVAWVSHLPHTGSFVLFLFAKKKNFSHPPSPRTVVNVTPLIIKNLIKIDFFLSFRLFSHISHSVRLMFRAQLTSHIAHTKLTYSAQLLNDDHWKLRLFH